MAGRHRKRQRRTLAVSEWLGAAAVTVGLGGALLGAAGAAYANTTGSDSGTHGVGGADRAGGSAKTKRTDAGVRIGSTSAKAHRAGPSTANPAGDTSKTRPEKSAAKGKAPASHRPKSTSGRTPTDDHDTSELKTASHTTGSMTAASGPAASASAAAASAPSEATEPNTVSPSSATAPPSASEPPVSTPPASASAEISAPSPASEPAAPPSAVDGLEQVAGLADDEGLDTPETLTGPADAATTAGTDTADTATTAAPVAADTATTATGTTEDDTSSIAAITTDTSAVAATQAVAASTAATLGSTSWLGSDIAQPGTYVQLAVQQIWDAQAELNTNTWGKANLVAGVVSLVPQTYLTLAQWALQSWQASNPVALNVVALTANTLVLDDVTTAMLIATEVLPTFAVASLQGADNATDLLSLFGAGEAESSADELIAQAMVNGRVYGVVPLTMYAGVVPIIEISVNGGPKVKVAVDTGSTGLVIGKPYVGQVGLGDPTGSGSSGYSGGLTYTYDEYNTTVDFGNGIETGVTTVNIVSDDSQAAFENYLSGNGVVGVLGIGANAVGPGPNLITSALPGELQDGIYIDQAAGLLVFGPNPMPARVTLAGSPYTTGVIQANGQSELLWLLIDSGGVYGTIPSTLLASVPSGTKISVYASDGSTLLYSYTTNDTNAPEVVSGTTANTGNIPFSLNRIYIGYSTAIGTTSFDF